MAIKKLKFRNLLTLLPTLLLSMVLFLSGCSSTGTVDYEKTNEASANGVDIIPLGEFIDIKAENEEKNKK